MNVLRMATAMHGELKRILLLGVSRPPLEAKRERWA